MHGTNDQDYPVYGGKGYQGPLSDEAKAAAGLVE